MVGLVTSSLPTPPKGTRYAEKEKERAGWFQFEISPDVSSVLYVAVCGSFFVATHLHVFPFSAWRLPSLAGYTGSTFTV